jgi:AbrB family looped-hinge helix DNA binding protein
MMAAVTISPKFQVVIPREVRERLGLTPGQKVQTILFEDRIELILKGIDTSVPRESDRI